MRTFIMGIDPGREGAAVMISTDAEKFYTIKSHPSPEGFLEWTRKIGKDDVIAEVWIEELSGRPGDTPNTAFELGTSYGIWQAFAQCVHPEVKYVKPQVWQTRFVRLITDGEVRYMPNDYGLRKRFIWNLVKEHVYENCFKYAADAAAIAYLNVCRHRGGHDQC